MDTTTENVRELTEEPLEIEAKAVEAEQPKPPAKLPPLWRNRDYMLLWSGQTVSNFGSSMSGIVFPLLILAITKSPAVAGFAAALNGIPYLIFSLPVGALIDRWDRKKVMMLCDAGRALNTASIPVALAVGNLTIWQLYINAFIEGTLFVFFNIAEVAALSRVVAKVQLPQASAQNEAGGIAANLAGPPAGGYLFQSVSHMFPFIFDAVSFGVSVLSLSFIRTRFQEERHPTEERHLGREIREGLSWLWHQPLIRFMAVLTGALNFAGNAVFLVLIVRAKELGAGEAEIGTMFSIAAVGGILGSIVGGQIQRRFKFGQVIITVGWFGALLFPLLVLAPNIYVIGLIGALSWMINPIYNIVQFSYRIALIPDKLQGRVNSVFRLLAFGFIPIGSALAGVLLERIGTVNTIFVFSAWLLTFAFLTTINSYVRNAKPLSEVQAQM
jgi:MFS family permease